MADTNSEAYNWYAANFHAISVADDLCSDFLDDIAGVVGFEIRHHTRFLTEGERADIYAWEELHAEVEVDNNQAVTGLEVYDFYLAALARHCGEAIVARRLNAFMVDFRRKRPNYALLTSAKLHEFGLVRFEQLLQLAATVKRPAFTLIRGGLAGPAP